MKIFTVLTATLIGLGLLAGCNNNVAPDSGGGTPLEALLRSQQAVFAQSSFRATSDVVEDAAHLNEHFTVIIEYLKPDRIHEQIGTHAEIISIGQAGFMKAEGGTWQASPVYANLAQDAKDTFLIGQTLSSDAQITALGAESLNGTPTLTYRVKYQNDSVAGETKFWIGANDNLPRRAESTGANIKTSVTTYEYNLPLKIDAPI